MIPKPSYQH